MLGGDHAQDLRPLQPILANVLVEEMAKAAGRHIAFSFALKGTACANKLHTLRSATLRCARAPSQFSVEQRVQSGLISRWLLLIINADSF